MTNDSIQLLTNEQLLADVTMVAGREREATVQLIALLSELDRRRLYLAEGYSSLFTFCTLRLRLSEHAAYNRIEAARAARKFPIIIELLAGGSVTLTAVRLLASHLTADNHQRVLAAAQHKSKREIEEQIASLQPLPPVPSTVRKLPERTARFPLAAAPCAIVLEDAPRPTPTCETAEPARARPIRTSPPVVAPLAPERYKVQLTISGETHVKLRRAQNLLRHVVPTGDPAAIFDRALTLLVADLERRKLGCVARPRQATAARAGGRHVPAAVRREVWSRDGGRCAFVGARGRCTEQGFLEFHHVVPFARGGPTNTENLQLRCRAHNAYQAETDFGPWIVREPMRSTNSFRNESALHQGIGKQVYRADRSAVRIRLSTVPGREPSRHHGLPGERFAYGHSSPDSRLATPSPVSGGAQHSSRGDFPMAETQRDK